MTEQEKFNTEIDKRVTNLETKFEAFMREMSEFKNEMRERDNQRAADIREIRAGLDSMGKHVRNLTVAAVVGIGAAVIGIGAIAVTVIYSVLTH